jgi:hypothetical protein
MSSKTKRQSLWKVFDRTDRRALLCEESASVFSAFALDKLENTELQMNQSSASLGDIGFSSEGKADPGDSYVIPRRDALFGKMKSLSDSRNLSYSDDCEAPVSPPRSPLRRSLIVAKAHLGGLKKQDELPASVMTHSGVSAPKMATSGVYGVRLRKVSKRSTAKEEEPIPVVTPKKISVARISRCVSQDSYAQFNLGAEPERRSSKPLDMDMLEDMISDSSSSSLERHIPTFALQESISTIDADETNDDELTKKENEEKAAAPKPEPRNESHGIDDGLASANEIQTLPEQSISGSKKNDAPLAPSGDGSDAFSQENATGPEGASRLRAPSGDGTNLFLDRTPATALRKSRSRRKIDRLSHSEHSTSSITRSKTFEDAGNPSDILENKEQDEDQVKTAAYLEFKQNLQNQRYAGRASKRNDFAERALPEERAVELPANNDELSTKKSLLDKIASATGPKRGVFSQLKRALSDRSFMSPRKGSMVGLTDTGIALLDGHMNMDPLSVAEPVVNHNNVKTPIATDMDTTTQHEALLHSEISESRHEKRRDGAKNRQKKSASAGRTSRRDTLTNGKEGRKTRRSKTPVRRRSRTPVRKRHGRAKSDTPSPRTPSRGSKGKVSSETGPTGIPDMSSPNNSPGSTAHKSPRIPMSPTSPTPPSSPTQSSPRSPKSQKVPKSPRRASMLARAKKNKEGVSSSTTSAGIDRVRSIPLKQQEGAKNRSTNTSSPRRLRKRLTVDYTENILSTTESAEKMLSLFAAPSTVLSDPKSRAPDEEIVVIVRSGSSEVDDGASSAPSSEGELETIELLSFSPRWMVQSTGEKGDDTDDSEPGQMIRPFQVPFNNSDTIDEQHDTRASESISKELDPTKGPQGCHAENKSKDVSTDSSTRVNDTIKQECSRLRSELMDSQMRGRAALDRIAILKRDNQELKLRLNEFICSCIS